LQSKNNLIDCNLPIFYLFFALVTYSLTLQQQQVNLLLLSHRKGRRT
jgi:hypothetical protein